jgi:hypothetical protein
MIMRARQVPEHPQDEEFVIKKMVTPGAAEDGWARSSPRPIRPEIA